MGEYNGSLHYTDIMQDWVRLGDEAENPYVKFMAYWVVFNMLYEPFKAVLDDHGKQRRDENGKRIWRSEFDAILKCCESFKNQFMLYDPFENGVADIFASKKLLLVYRWPKEKVEKERLDLEGRNVTALLKAVDRVRCNFFHGNKTLGGKDDCQFVASGAAIVRGYLGTLGFACPIEDARQ